MSRMNRQPIVRVVAWADRFASVVADAAAHLGQVLDAVGMAVELPRFRHLQRGEAAVEAAADDPVVRSVGFEEERLTDLEDVKGAPAAGSPEVDLGQLRSGGEEPVPVAIGYAHVGLHATHSPRHFPHRHLPVVRIPQLTEEEYANTLAVLARHQPRGTPIVRSDPVGWLVLWTGADEACLSNETAPSTARHDQIHHRPGWVWSAAILTRTLDLLDDVLQRPWDA